jgi:hypothetical protein
MNSPKFRNSHTFLTYKTKFLDFFEELIKVSDKMGCLLILVKHRAILTKLVIAKISMSWSAG